MTYSGAVVEQGGGGRTTPLLPCIQGDALFLRHNALRVEIADTATLGAGLLVNHGVH